MYDFTFFTMPQGIIRCKDTKKRRKERSLLFFLDNIIFLRKLYHKAIVEQVLFIIVSLAKAILITIIHTIRINLPSHFGYAILIIIDILQQKLKDWG